ncbi:glutathione S-transferase N-terminal domain-containing protein [Salipiger manganoxidans]|uniref:glutathione S-transferase n=1 Tax=Salipiger marinus TaxID=555512 RepID=UPI001E3B5D8F|nr:glutathione S-transferase N-terminal domain-containing protein [Salipiger manganoxidans]MCD1619335.1 glutathione S-transferase N-terminal domain-containing protein [Salipiger manganoxidans]
MMTLHDLWQDPATPLVLRTTTTSPFGRKVRIAAQVLGLDGRLSLRPADTRDPEDTLRQQNPLGKMPCLLIGTEPFYDSSVILDLLDLLAGGGQLLPPVTSALPRLRALTRARLADGITEAALLMVYEGRFRAPDQVSQIWLEHLRGKVMRGLADFEQAPPDPTRACLVSIGLACALGYLDWRQPVDWRGAHPVLTGWLDQFAAAVPAFSATERDLA